MSPDDVVDVRGLSVAARGMMRYLAQLLATNYSGRIVLECQDGGIRELRKTDSVRPSDLDRPDAA